MGQPKQYTLILLSGVLSTMLFILCFNLLLAKQYGYPDRFQRASEWQEKTHGITMALIQGRNSVPFKILRLNDRLPNINAVVFGSSTAMGIESNMFPSGIRIYNFSQFANFLNAIIGQVEYVLDHDEQVQYMFVPLEWAIGFLYFPGEPPATDLSSVHVLQQIAADDKKPSWSIAIKDALSYPKIANLMGVFEAIVSSDDKIVSFREAFTQRNGDEYYCQDGLAKDYEPDLRGRCNGFRYDGSLHFRRASNFPTNPRSIMKDSLRVHSFVRNVLQMTKGHPRAELLERLGEQARRLERRGGRLVFFMPPVYSRLEAIVLEQPDVGDYLRRTKAEVSQWAVNNRFVLLDFGPSENFGCIASEFADGAHATASCYRKIFNAVWQMHPDLMQLPSKMKQE
jgi:hypothetical protein